MWRSLLAISLIYGWGHPSLDGYRPPLLDRPLQSFHQDVNQTARDGRKAIANLDDMRPVRYVLAYIAPVRSGD
jgi:hypothetical protein